MYVYCGVISWCRWFQRSFLSFEVRGLRIMTFRFWLVGFCVTMYSMSVLQMFMGRRYLIIVSAMLKFLGLFILKLSLKKQQSVLFVRVERVNRRVTCVGRVGGRIEGLARVFLRVQGVMVSSFLRFFLNILKIGNFIWRGVDVLFVFRLGFRFLSVEEV